MNKNFGTDSFDTTSFEEHSTKLLRSLLYGRGKVAAITSKETYLLANKTILRELNSTLDTSIIELIDEMHTFVYPSDVALFLAAAHKENLLKEAVEIIDSVRSERRLMSLDDLSSALAETSNMPASWASALFGGIDAEREAKPVEPQRKPTIDLSAMQRGMGL